MTVGWRRCESAWRAIRQSLRRWLAAFAPPSRVPTIVPLTATGLAFVESEHGAVPKRQTVRVEYAIPPAVADDSIVAAGPIAPPAARLVRIANARTAAGVVQLADHTIVEESLVNTAPFERFGPFSRDDAGRLTRARQRVARRLHNGPHVLLKQQYDANYGHWLMEALPRLAIVEDHVPLQDCTFVVSRRQCQMRAVYRDSLALFGIRPEQIVEAGNETIHVDDLLYPTPITCHPWHFSPRCIEALERIASRVRANPFGFDRLYVSRNRTKTRHLVNEAEIVAIAERHGFVVVEPETLTLYQQIGLFRSARIVVGNCGAALTNAVFAAGDVTLFALTTPMMQDDFFPTMMSLKGGRFLSQHGIACDPSRGLASDFTLDSAHFERMLRTII